MNESADRTLTKALMERPEDIAELFSSAANPARVKMMAMLTCGEQGLNDLMTAAGLSKNAAVNHLTKLMGMGMVKRMSRGRYALTNDGRGLILTGTRLFMDSNQRGDMERERLRQLYIRGREEGLEMERRTVASKGSYICCWISFNGAMGGALRAQGVECDLVDVSGRTGYAFLLNVPKGRMCPSAPTALEDSVYREMVKGAGELGAECRLWTEPGGYMGNQDPSETDKGRARRLFEMVKRDIDTTGRPVVLWGLPIPEFGIVNGYEGTRYVASTYRSMDAPEKEELVEAEALQSPGCLMAVSFAPGRDHEGRWLARAVEMASGKIDICEGYLAGPKAAQEWSNCLLKADDSEYIGNSYTAACWSEGRSNAGVFLRRMARKQRGRVNRELLEAAGAYAKGAQVMEEYVGLFPFNFQGRIGDQAREKGAALLMELKGYEEDAVLHMKDALLHWPREG
ncbi:MAG: ArsR/SmtB family transcription factor [Methanomassiliicoccales archaeon]